MRASHFAGRSFAHAHLAHNFHNRNFRGFRGGYGYGYGWYGPVFWPFAYDDLFRDSNKRVEDILAEYGALPAGASTQERDAIRKKFCAAAGETLGLYKFVRALARDCQALGEPLMDQLLDILRQQLLAAEQGINAPCFGLMSAT